MGDEDYGDTAGLMNYGLSDGLYDPVDEFNYLDDEAKHFIHCTYQLIKRHYKPVMTEADFMDYEHYRQQFGLYCQSVEEAPRPTIGPAGYSSVDVKLQASQMEKILRFLMEANPGDVLKWFDWRTEEPMDFYFEESYRMAMITFICRNSGWRERRTFTGASMFSWGFCKSDRVILTEWLFYDHTVHGGLSSYYYNYENGFVGPPH
jgi:hypothetical protein